MEALSIPAAAAAAAPPLPPPPLASRTGSPNGLTHGLTSRAACISCEDPAAFEAYRDDLAATLAPEDAAERHLVEMMVMAGWRLRRVWRIESGIHRHWQGKWEALDDTGAYALLNDCLNERALTHLSRFEAQLTRSFLQAEQRLRLLQDLRRKGLRAAATPAGAADAVARQADPPPAPGLPGSAADPAEPDRAEAGEQPEARMGCSASVIGENENRPGAESALAAEARAGSGWSRVPQAAD